MSRKCLVAVLFMTLPAGSTLTPERSEAQMLGKVAFCRHDVTESASDRSRREAALLLARAINGAERGLADRTGTYGPLAHLGNLPPTPAGFELRLFADDAAYAFSIKDELDICRWAVFSDQDGLLYEKTPRLVQMAGSQVAN